MTFIEALPTICQAVIGLSGVAIGRAFGRREDQKKIARMRDDFERARKIYENAADVRVAEALSAAECYRNPDGTPYRSPGVQGPAPDKAEETLTPFLHNPDKCPSCGIDRTERITVEDYASPVAVFEVAEDDDECRTGCPDRLHHHVECRSCGMTWLLAPAVPPPTDPSPGPRSVSE